MIILINTEIMLGGKRNEEIRFKNEKKKKNYYDIKKIVLCIRPNNNTTITYKKKFITVI